MKLSRNWEGKLVDVSGANARVRLSVQEEGGALRGEFAVYFAQPDDDSCGDVSERLAMIGGITGRIDSDGSLVQLASEFALGERRILVELRGRLIDADPHARSAIFGTYEVLDGAELLTVEGGSCVLWHYAGTDREVAWSTPFASEQTA
jgi:hypothetical protein